MKRRHIICWMLFWLVASGRMAAAALDSESIGVVVAVGRRVDVDFAAYSSNNQSLPPSQRTANQLRVNLDKPGSGPKTDSIDFSVDTNCPVIVMVNSQLPDLYNGAVHLPNPAYGTDSAFITYSVTVATSDGKHVFASPNPSIDPTIVFSQCQGAVGYKLKLTAEWISEAGGAHPYEDWLDLPSGEYRGYITITIAAD